MAGAVIAEKKGRAMGRVCMDTECANDKIRWQAEVGWVGENTAEAVDLTSENVALTLFIDVGG